MAMCKANSEAADELGNPELARIWQLASKVALAASEIGEKNEKGAWAHCPMGRPLLSSLLSHHLQCKDFQTVALLVCAFTNDETPVSTEKPTGASAPAAKRQILVFEKRSAHWNSWGRWGLSVPYSPQVVIISIVATTRNENNVFCTHSAGPGYSATVGGGGQQVKTHSMFKTSFVHKTKPKRINIVDCFLGAVHILRQPKSGVPGPPSPPRQQWSAFGLPLLPPRQLLSSFA